MSDDLTLEKLKIHERLAKIEAQNEQLLDVIQNVYTSLHGNGKEGLLVRFDRIEQHEKNKKAIFGFILISVIGLVGRGIYDFLLWVIRK